VIFHVFYYCITNEKYAIVTIVCKASIVALSDSFLWITLSWFYRH